MSERTWTIRPVHVGTLHRKRLQFLYGSSDTTPLDVPVIMYVLESGGERVLVDTGCADPRTAHADHHPFDRSEDQHPVEALRSLGIPAESISAVINTHLHWDHCSGNHLFPNARCYTQRAELRYAAAPLPWNCRSYESYLIGGDPAWARIPFHVLEGDVFSLFDGIDVLATPGHTPGSQSILVRGSASRYVLAGDNVPLYDNWVDARGRWPYVPNANHYDLSAYAATLNRLKSLRAEVIPSHDIRVLERAVYK